LFDRPADRLYPILDDAVCAARGVTVNDLALACFRGGARVVQLRVKSGASARFLDLASELTAAARAFDAAVIVNDRADIARIAGAAGVHVGQDDLPPDAVRGVFPDAVVGLSTHDRSQVDLALASAADYVAVGPIFATATKETGYSGRGTGLVTAAARRGKRVVAIGGIDLERAPRVLEAGADSVAVIADLFTGEDPETRVRAYLRALA
jgi:thiamine-phosphate pyrophosphorylase